MRRLGTDYIDVYYAHFPDPDTPLEQTLVVYDDLVRQGKLRYVALSNHPAWQVTQALWIAEDRVTGLSAHLPVERLRRHAFGCQRQERSASQYHLSDEIHWHRQ